ncbi:MAG: hypothetical protein LBO79_00145 [Zoogloeaceae bacterium]|nr:hypothetical protein [Zoogloeaceae bacterium]
MSTKRSDWVPKAEEKLLELIALWQTKLNDFNLQNLYGWPANECTATVTVMGNFVTARATYHTTPTQANRLDKEEKRKAAVDAIRQFAREYIRNNSKMTDAQKLELGVKVSDREPTPIPVPDKGPESKAEISAQEPGVVKVRYLGAKPYGVDRIEIAWSLSPTVISSPDQLTHNDSFPKNPWERTFPAEERGKKLYYSLRYLTREGKSHWSDVREVVIP